MPDTQVERISQLDIGDGKRYEFAGANSGIVFDTLADAQAAIQAGTVKAGDVFYVKYVSSGGTEVDAAGVGYDNTESELTADNVQDAVDEVVEELGNTDISDIGDGSLSGAISTLNSKLPSVITSYDVENITFSQAYAPLYQHLLNKVDNLGNARIEVYTSNSHLAQSIKYTSYTSGVFIFSLVQVNENNSSFINYIIKIGSATSMFINVTIKENATTITDMSSKIWNNKHTIKLII